MKKHIGAVVTVAAFVAWIGTLEAIHRQAEAQVVVNDPAHIAIQAGEFVQQAQRHVETVAQGAEQLGRLETQVRQGVRMYEAVTNIDSMQDVLSLAGQFGLKTPLPASPHQLQAILQGTGGWQGMMSNMGGLFNGLRPQNAVYQPRDALNWVGQQLVRQVDAATGAQAAAMAFHQEIEQRQTIMEELRASIPQARTPAERETIANSIAAEQTQVNRLQTGLQTVSLFASGQQTVIDGQRQLQSMRSLDEAIQARCARVGLTC